MTDNTNPLGAVQAPAARRRSLLAPLAAALVLAGCMTQPVVPAPHAGVPVPDAFSAGSQQAAVPPAPGRWPRPLRRSLVANGGWVFKTPHWPSWCSAQAVPTPASSKPLGAWPRPARCCARPTLRARCRWAHRRA